MLGRWNPLTRLFGNWIRRVPLHRRLRAARVLGVAKWSIALLLAAFVAWQEFGNGSPTPLRMETTSHEAADAAAIAAEIKSTWNIEVRYGPDTSNLILNTDRVPPTWHLDPVAAPDLLPGLRAIKTALSVYPVSYVSTVRDDASVVFLTRSILVGGQSFGGMYFGGAIYVPARDMENASRVDFAADTFHHEFSLTGLSRGPSPQAAWRAVNPPGFVYRGDRDLAIVRDIERRADGGDQTDDVRDAGFIIRYAQSSMTEDWQTYAEQAFGHPAELVDLVTRFPRIKAKTKIFIDHYGVLDPGFGAYFDRTGLRDAVK